MAFEREEDFRELLRLLRERPDWARELRRVIFEEAAPETRVGLGSEEQKGQVQASGEE